MVTSASADDAAPPLFGRIADLTTRFTSSLLGQVAAYAAAVTAAVLAVQKLNEPLRGVPLWGRAVIFFAPIVLALTLHTIPALLAERRKARLKEIKGHLKPGYFSLAPRDDESLFRRADDKHNEVLAWIGHHAERVLYLTGLSGSGKSSLLTAWVVPQLRRQDTQIISLRGFQDIVAVLQSKLTEAGVIGQEALYKPHEILALLEGACEHVQSGRLLIIIDQFEECLIHQDPERIQRLGRLFSSLHERPFGNLTFLLVFRSDYIGLIGKFSLPPLIQGRNWKEVPPFTERDAQEFMLGSGLEVSSELLRGVLREAAEIEQTKGLIRPVTINLCGLVLGRFATGVPRSFRPGALLRGFLQESVTLPTVREVAPRLLSRLITSSVTKMPRTITDLGQITGLDEAVVRGCMLFLGQTDRAIVRPLDDQQETWEISHDFLVPLLDSIIARRSVSLWRRVRPYFPWFAAATLVLTFRVFSDSPPTGPQFGQLGPMHTSDSEAYQRMNNKFEVQPFPQPRGGVEPVLRLADVFGSAGPGISREIEKAGKIVFHAVGSTGNTLGIGDPGVSNGPRRPMGTLLVADKMENDFRGDAAKSRPSFLFLLGDIIYSFGESQYYYGQFYLPYVQYPAPIFAIPGNHDGMVVPGTNVPTLQAFLDNFCAEGFHQTSASRGLGRTAQIQPGVFFTLEAPFVRILALYSNTLEGPGVISSEGGRFPTLIDAQSRFLEAALDRVKKERFGGAVIIAVHHDPYSLGFSGGSPRMVADLDAVSKRTGVWPHAIISGHAHNYQRYTRAVDEMQIPYIVAGNGGYGVARRIGSGVSTPSNLPAGKANVRREAFDDQNLGFLRITVDREQLHVEFQPVSGAVGDSVTVDLKTRRLVK